MILPPPPPYTGPNLASKSLRDQVASSLHTSGDPDKAVKKFYELAHLADPPLRFLIGKDAITNSRAQLKGIEGDVSKYESWSEGLELEKKA